MNMLKPVLQQRQRRISHQMAELQGKRLKPQVNQCIGIRWLGQRQRKPIHVTPSCTAEYRAVFSPVFQTRSD